MSNLNALPQNLTVEATDLFNRMPEIFIVTVPQGGNSGGSLNLGQALNHASQGAANRNTGLAPAHLQMANSLIGENGNPNANTDPATNRGVVDWKKLGGHLEVINEYPRCVCFNCGMTMYPSKAKDIVCARIKRKEDCRAYRVFVYYIRALVDRLHVNLDDVFKCEPTGPGGTCSVY